jgi:hypothetical protein
MESSYRQATVWMAGEKQIGGNFGSICIIPRNSRRRVNIFIAESGKVRTARL